MLLKEGDKILVAHRRLYERDEARYFVGRVEGYEAGVIRATGHTFVREQMCGRVIEKAEKRTKLLSVASGTLLIYILPEPVALERMRFVSELGRLVLTDGNGFTMNLAEVPQGGRW